jgi:hypothetical protein
VVAVGGENQNDSDNMVSEHLPMVLSSFFHIDNHNLLQPKGILDEDVELGQATNFSARPIGPKISQIEPVVGGGKNILPRAH